MQVQSAERAEFLGYRVVKAVREWTRHDGAVMTAELLLAPGLNCYRLKETSTLRLLCSSHAAMTTTEVLTVREVSPDPTSFAIDQDLVEQQPSQAIEARMAARGLECANCQLAHGELDRAYASHQKH